MNKLFYKVATLSVGLAMAIGVGVGLGSKAPVRARAAYNDGTECVLWTSGYQASTDYTTSADGAIKWKNSAANTYSSPTRIYANNTFTIEIADASKAESINGIVVVANNNDYGNATNSATWTPTGGTLSKSLSSATVTCTASGAVTSLTIKPSAQVRWNSVTVYYSKPTGAGYTSIGNGAESKDSGNNTNIVWTNIAGLTISQNKGSSGTAVNTSYNTPSTVRFYVGHVFAFVADTANGYAILGVKMTNSTSSSYYGGNYTANTVWSSVTSSISTNDTTNLTLTNCTSTTSGSISSVEAKNTTTGVGAIYISTSKQSRPSAITVNYIKPEASDPTGISCSNQSITVTETINLKNLTTISPAGATTDLSFTITSGSDCIDLDTTTGVVTGKKGGSSVVKITPTNTSGGATAIDVSITVSSLPVPGITVGNNYVIYALSDDDGNYELTGVSSNLGTTSLFEGNIPPCSYVLSTEAGYFENTVAFKHGSDYLALSSNDNKLQTSSSITKDASWKVVWNSETYSATLTNAVYSSRTLQFNYNAGSSRFACYASEFTGICLYPYVEKNLVDFSIDSEINVYKTATKQIHVTYDPADAADKTLTWSSSNASVASVVDGVVTGVSVGTATITASKTINSVLVSKTCTVHVVNNVSTHRGTETDPFSVDDAYYVAKGVLTKDPDNTTIDLSNSYYVTGIITAASSRTASQLTFFIGDSAEQTNTSKGGFEIYKVGKVYGTAIATYYTGKSNSFVANDFGVGHYVTVYSTFTEYNGTPETNQNIADVKWNNYIEAREYAATSFLTDVAGTCESDGTTDLDDLKLAWASTALDYDELSTEAKSIFVNGSGSESANAYDVQKAIALYDYVATKYGHNLESEDLDNFDFMGRNITPTSNTRIAIFGQSSVDQDTTLIVIISSIVGVAAVGGYFFLRRKKEQ